MKQGCCNINSIFIPALLPPPQLYSQCVPRAALPTPSAWRTTRVSASHFTTGMASLAQVSSSCTARYKKAGCPLLHMPLYAVTIRYEMLAIKPKNFHSVASETNLGFIQIRFLLKQVAASPGFTRQEQESESHRIAEC